MPGCLPSDQVAGTASPRASHPRSAHRPHSSHRQIRHGTFFELCKPPRCSIRACYSVVLGRGHAVALHGAFCTSKAREVKQATIRIKPKPSLPRKRLRTSGFFAEWLGTSWPLLWVHLWLGGEAAFLGKPKCATLFKKEGPLRTLATHVSKDSRVILRDAGVLEATSLRGWGSWLHSSFEAASPGALRTGNWGSPTAALKCPTPPLS